MKTILKKEQKPIMDEITNLVLTKNDDSISMLIEIFKKLEPTKKDMVLATGLAFMAGLEKGKEPVKN